MKGKGFISEGDIALLLRRYTANTLLSLLREISCAADSKLNWSVLTKSSSTGIANAKEYQSLWRHLAYRANIPDTFEDDVPLDDDSDLEFEVEPVPGVSQEVATNVSACVKVLSATGTPENVSSKNQEPSFVIDIPNSTSGCEVKGNGQISNIVIQGAQASEAQPVRKKRKLWTSEEDQELISAVEKCGEGNWATMLKGAFKHERTAAQLSQRWALIRKRRELQTGTLNIGENQIPVIGTNVAGCQLPVETSNSSQADVQIVAPVASTPSIGVVSEHTLIQTASTSNSTPVAQLTGKHKTPAKRTSVSGAQQGRSMTASVSASANAGQVKPVSTSSVPLSGGSSRYVPASIRNSPVNVGGRTPSKSSAGPDPMVQAAAVAAGARIAPASAAASLLKAAQSGNVVHIGVGGVPMGKAVTPNQTSSSPAGNSSKIGQTVGSKPSGGAFVHYIRTATGSSPSSNMVGGQRPSPLKSQTRPGPQAVYPQSVQNSVRPGPASPAASSQPMVPTSTIISHPSLATTSSTTKTTDSPEPKIPSQDSNVTGTLLHRTIENSGRCVSNNGMNGQDVSKAESSILEVEATKHSGAIET